MKNRRTSMLVMLAAIAIAGLFFIKNFSQNHPPAMFFASDKFVEVLEDNRLYHIGVAQHGSFGVIESKKNNTILIGDIDQGTHIHVLFNKAADLKVLEVNNGSQIHIYLASKHPEKAKLSISKVGNGSQVHVYSPIPLTDNQVESAPNVTEHQLMLSDKKIGSAEIFAGNNSIEIHQLSPNEIRQQFNKHRTQLQTYQNTNE